MVYTIYCLDDESVRDKDDNIYIKLDDWSLCSICDKVVETSWFCLELNQVICNDHIIEEWNSSH